MCLVKCYADLGEYVKADETLFRILNEAPSRALRGDKSRPVNLDAPPADMNLSREARMLGALVSSALGSLKDVGFCHKSILTVYDVDNSGVMKRRNNVATELIAGKHNELFSKINAIKITEKLRFDEEKVIYERNEILDRVSEARSRIAELLRSHDEFLAEIGPIVMPEG